MVYWGEECFEWEKYPALASWKDSNITRTLWIIGIIAIVVGVISLFVNFLKFGKGYFVIALVATVLLLVLVCVNGFLLRNIYQEEVSPSMDGQCSANLAPIAQDEIKQWCPTKYSANTCRKQDITVAWDVDKTPVKSLNPACCGCTKQYYIWPFYMLAIMSLFLTLSTFVFLASAFYLSDNVENYGAHKLVDSLDSIFIGLGLLALIIFGLYFIFRGANTIGNSNESYKSYVDPEGNPDPNFKLVNPSLKTAVATENDGCYHWNSKIYQLPTFSSTYEKCKDPANCIMRVAILSRNAKIEVGDMASIVGNVNTRQQFFPGCSSSNNQFTFFYGTEANIQKTIQSIKFCPKNPAKPELDAAYYVDQVDKKLIDNGGMLNDENPSMTLKPADEATCLKDWKESTAVTACTAICQLKLTGALTFTTVKGRFFLYNAAGEVDYTIPKTLTITAMRNGIPIGAPGNLFANGYFTIPQIPVMPTSDYPLTVAIDDQSNTLLQDTIDVLISHKAATETSAGTIALLSADGRFCAETDTTCKDAITPMRGLINVTVVQSVSGAPASNIEVKLRATHSLTGAEVASNVTNSQGYAIFNNTNYGPYMIVINDASYEPASQRVNLREKASNISIGLLPINTDSDMRVTMTTNDPTVDFDLMMYARNPAGKECVCSPINKYCAYSYHYSDVSTGQTGSEIINIKRLAVAEYKTTAEPAPAYNLQCAEVVATQNAHMANAVTWDWNTVKKTVALKDIKFKVKTSSLADKNAGGIYTAVLAQLSEESPVQDRKSAMEKTLLISTGGDIMEKPATTYIPTKEEIAKGDPAVVGGINGANASKAPEEEKTSGSSTSATTTSATTTSATTTSATTTSATTTSATTTSATTTAATSATTTATTATRILATTGTAATGTAATGTAATGTAAVAVENVVLISCFTGFGQASTVTVWGLYEKIPDWTECQSRIPTAYSLTQLDTKNKEAEAKKI